MWEGLVQEKINCPWICKMGSLFVQGEGSFSSPTLPALAACPWGRASGGQRCPQAWPLGSGLFSWPRCLPHHFIFLVPTCTWVSRAAGSGGGKGTWPHTTLDGGCLRSAGLWGERWAVCARGSPSVAVPPCEDKDLLVCIHRAAFLRSSELCPGKQLFF